MASWWTTPDMLDSLDLEENSIVSRVIQAVGLFGDILSIEDTMEPMLPEPERGDGVRKGIHINKEHGVVGGVPDTTNMQDKVEIRGDGVKTENENGGLEKKSGDLPKGDREYTDAVDEKERKSEEKNLLEELNKEEEEQRCQDEENKSDEEGRDNDEKETMMKMRGEDGNSEEIKKMKENKNNQESETKNDVNVEKETEEDEVEGNEEAKNHDMGRNSEDFMDMDQIEDDTTEEATESQYEKLKKKREVQNQSHKEYEKCDEKEEQGQNEETEDLEQEREEIIEIIDYTIGFNNNDVEKETNAEVKRQEKQGQIDEKEVARDEVKEMDHGELEKEEKEEKKLGEEPKEIADDGNNGEKEEMMDERIKNNDEQESSEEDKEQVDHKKEYIDDNADNAVGKEKNIDQEIKEMEEKEDEEEDNEEKIKEREEESFIPMDADAQFLKTRKEKKEHLTTDVNSEMVAKGFREEKHPIVPEISTEAEEKKNKSLPPAKYKTVSYRRIRKGNTKQKIDEYEAMINTS